MKTSIPALKPTLLPFLRRIYPKFALVIAHLIAFLLPEKLWYPVAYQLTCALTAFTRPIIAWTPQRKNWLLYGWLKLFLHYERPFPIPIRTLGEEVVKEARTNPGGMLVVSVHLPLGIFILRSLVEIGCPPTAVIAHGDLLKNGAFPIWGTVDGLPGLATDGNVLVKTRRILRHGGSIGAMIDAQLGEPISTNILRLLRFIGARMVFALVDLHPSGEIVVKFYNPPDPYCGSDEGILKNLEFFQSKLGDLLGKSYPPYPDLKVGAREIDPQVQNGKKNSGADSPS
jgi:hypothetical protein